jgi:hypothetical protein
MWLALRLNLLGKIKKHIARDKFVPVRIMKIYAKGAEL